MASFYDNKSSNGCKTLTTRIDYTTTAKDGYTTVTAKLYVCSNYYWNFIASNGYSLTINRNTKNGSGATVKGDIINDVGQPIGDVLLLEHSVNVYHTTNKDITISAKVNLNNVYYISGGYYVGEYDPSGSVTLIPAITRVTEPTTLTVNNGNTYFEDDVKIDWSGASSGINNPISGYDIRVYLANSANTGWVDTPYDCDGNADTLTHITNRNSYGSYTADLSWVPRGRHTYISIMTTGDVSGYWSADAKTSATIVRQPYTQCQPPSSFTVSPNMFNKSVNLAWSGASGGTSNNISGYTIEYAVSSNNSTWGSWIALQSYSTTLSSGNLSIDISSKVTRGQYVKFRIRTQGSAGSSYYSTYQESNSIQRDPKSKCQPPSTFILQAIGKIDTSVTSTTVFEDEIVLNWNAGTAGDNVTISGYIIEKQTSTNKSDWSDWSNVQTVQSLSYTVDMSSLNRGDFIRFRIKTQASDTTYNSDNTMSGIMKRNSLPNAISLDDIIRPKSFSNGDDIVLQWNSATDPDNQSPYITAISGYKIYGRYSSGVNSDIWSPWEVIHTSLSSTTQYTISSSSTFYGNIANEQYCEIKIVPYDMFCGSSQLSTLLSQANAISIQRYDISGVAMGVNNQWIDCQIYYGQNNDWEMPNKIYAGMIVNGVLQWVLVYDGEIVVVVVDAREYFANHDLIEVVNAPMLDTSSCTDFYWMCGDCLDLETVPLYDTSNGTNFEGMFYACKSLTSVPQFNTSNGENFSQMFHTCESLTEMPLLDTSNGTDFSDMLNSCEGLTTVPLFDTSNGTNFNSMLSGCSSLTSVPLFDTSNGEDFGSMFFWCTNLTSIPQFDTSNGTNFEYMFYDCDGITTIPLLDTSEGTDFNHMFSECDSLTSIPQLNTSNGTNFYGMFRNCPNLLTVPAIDTSKGTGLNQMFDGCTSITTLPQLDTSECTNFYGMFKGCTSLVSIGEIDFSSLAPLTSTNKMPLYAMFTNCSSLTTVSFTANSLQVNDNFNIFAGCNQLSTTSLVSFLNCLKDNTGGTNYTVKIPQTLYNKLSSAQIQIATDKNITLTTI